MKIYVHFEKEPEFTLICEPLKKDLKTIKDLKSYFIEQYKASHGNPHEFSINSIDIKDQKNKTLLETTLITKVFSNLDDAFIFKNSNVDKPTTTTTTTPTPTATTTTPTPTTTTTTTTTQRTPPTSATPTTKQPPLTIQTLGPDGKVQTPSGKFKVEGCDARLKTIIESLLDRAEPLFLKKSYRTALEIYDQILKMHDEEKYSLLKSAEIYFQAKKYTRAEALIAKGIEAHPKEYQFHLLKARLKSENKDFFEACKSFKNVLNLVPKSNPVYNNLKAEYGTALYDTRVNDYAQQGCQLLNEVMGEDENNMYVMMGFAHVLIDRGQYEDAFNSLLRLASAAFPAQKEVTRFKEYGWKNVDTRPFKKEREWVQEKLTDVVMAKGLDMVYKAFEPQPIIQKPQIYGFVASMIKDNGAVNEATELLRKAFQLDKKTPNYILTLCHNLEVINKYPEAVEHVMTYLQVNRAKGIRQFKIDNGVVYDLVKPYLKNPIEDSYSFKLPMPEQGPTKVAEDLLVVNEKDHCDNEFYKEDYNKEELDYLSLWFTLTKILYTLGILEPLPALIKLLEPAKKGRDLHLTTVRNEQAYFSSVSMLMSYRSLPLPNHRPIYVAGDSHSLSTAWTPVTINGEPRLFHPLLTTGLKMWHLRPESRFFPKANFYNVTTTAPRGSEIVFLFGEIDCREGFVVSVDKCIYETIEEGMRVTIDIYIKALKDLISKYQYKIYIHPVVPVLDATRSMVKTFNKIFKEKILAQGNTFVWLDFFDQLLSPEGGFNLTYELDATHMNPSYVSLIESEINKNYKK
ncbi:hypothetical protein CYY_004201 [Polysphondylium violaceum]|uniref:Tetratricopeptide-like helical domain-containing protein n=1 Tax=Polysphondylium violaceum TaxID=133409 RepID=A0A8J4PVT4_9MYCE|nr:hypothetical protein CYY_004201 [Polysphondylium violaceum]